MNHKLLYISLSIILALCYEIQLSETQAATVYYSTSDSRVGSMVLGGADIDRNGLPDISATSVYAQTSATMNQRASVLISPGSTQPTSATATASHLSGNTGRVKFGNRNSTVLRTALSFTGGSSSVSTATLYHAPGIIQNLGTGTIASLNSLAWNVQTNRTSWSAATLALRYSDAEIAPLNEAGLKIYRSNAASGPWTELSAAQNLQANLFTFSASQLGWFAIGEPNTPGSSCGNPLTETVTFGPNGLAEFPPFGVDWETGQEVLPCFSGSNVVSRWMTVTLPAGATAHFELYNIRAIGYYESCDQGPYDCTVNPDPGATMNLFFDNFAAGTKVIYVLINSYASDPIPTGYSEGDLTPHGLYCYLPLQLQCGDFVFGSQFSEPNPWLMVKVPAQNELDVIVTSAADQVGVSEYADCDSVIGTTTSSAVAIHRLTNNTNEDQYRLIRAELTYDDILEIRCVHPPNDHCITAISFPCGGDEIVGPITVDARISLPDSCSTTTEDVWYYVDVPLAGRGVNVYYKDNQTTFAAGFLELLTGGECGEPASSDCATSRDAYGPSFYRNLITVSDNQRVWIRVGSNSQSTTQTLSVSCFKKLD